jgi:hypothetical protein
LPIDPARIGAGDETTVNSSLAMRWATAAPMPRELPVTIAILVFALVMKYLLQA